MRLGLIELNFKEGEKVKISPVGDVVGVDGRRYKIDGKEVVANTKKNSVDIVLDVNHGWDKDGEKAAGWFDISSLEAREDGIYASLNTTEIGKEHIDKRFFRYLSPAYVMDRNREDRVVLSIDSVGLVNKPNVLDKALNKNQHKEKEEMPTQEQIDKLQEQNRTLQEENERLNTKVKTLETSITEANNALKVQKIENAISRGDLTPNKKEFAMSLDGEMLDKFIVINKKDIEHLKSETKQNTQANSKEQSKEEIEINRQLGINEEGEDIL